jgi:chaperonin GroEL
VFRSPPNDATLAELGRARRVIVGKDTTTIVEGASKREDFERRIHQIRAEIEAVRSDYEREKLNERLAALVGGVAVVKMGGLSETDIRRKKERVEQAVCAVRAAVNDGVVPGGGIALLRASQVVQGAQLGEYAGLGADIIRRACQRPAVQICTNAGHDPDRIIARLLALQPTSIGFNVVNGQYEDLIAANIVEPAGLPCTALQSAFEVTTRLLSIGGTIVNE